jgi:iron complex transport system ATP-binding protein
MSVTDYVLLGRSAHHTYLGAETARDRRVAAAVLERLQLSAFAKRLLGELSGGESQRVVLARALVQEAPVLVMDEPTTSLDLGHSQLVLELADELRREKGLCVLCAIHDLTLAAQYSERLLVLSQGHAVLSGPPTEVLTEVNIRRFFEAEVEVLDGASGPAVSPVRRQAVTSRYESKVRAS